VADFHEVNNKRLGSKKKLENFFISWVIVSVSRRNLLSGMHVPCQLFSVSSLLLTHSEMGITDVMEMAW
jgi:hypothetical protein